MESVSEVGSFILASPVKQLKIARHLVAVRPVAHTLLHQITMNPIQMLGPSVLVQVCT